MAVGLVPYAVWALLIAVFAVGYLAALARFLCAGPGGADALERLVLVSANAVVAILTLTSAEGLPRYGAEVVEPGADGTARSSVPRRGGVAR